jgi:hypothetical protein
VKKTTRSLLEELNDIYFKKDKESVVEARASHVINSAINLLELMKQTYTQEQSAELEKRFLNSIRTGDPSKFIRGIKKIKESMNTVKKFKIIEGKKPIEKKD